ncbi:MAG: T9SS type A sorting domain-containing protein [Rubricoccaceae bacterium]|nr:T9SS type A sorting domain-containing protein [Rubricoccaceae bacterium]
MPRRLPLALAALTLLAAPALAQAPAWDWLSDSPYNGYRSEDVFFIDEAEGWAVNGSGEVWRTQDGGDAWALTATPDGYLRSVGFASETHGWVGVLFSDAVLYETTDGGLSFTDVTDRIVPAVNGGICALWVVDDDLAYGAGQWSGPAYLIKTTDGGQTWASSSLGEHLDVAIDVYFFDDSNGLVAGGVNIAGGTYPRVIGTTDGGDTWTVRHTFEDAPFNSWLWKLSFPTPEVGYASVEHGYFGGNEDDGFVLKTTDGGQTWTEVTIPDGASLQGVGFATPEIGWASGRGTTSVTTDGGQTWEQIDVEPNESESINRFRFIGDVGYAAGHYIYKTDLSAVAAEPGADPAATRLVLLAPNPTPGALTATYHLARTGPVHVAVLDVLGRTVAVLADGVEAAGTQVARWDAGASGAAPGAYLVRLQTDDGVWARPVTVLR